MVWMHIFSAATDLKGATSHWAAGSSDALSVHEDLATGRDHPQAPPKTAQFVEYIPPLNAPTIRQQVKRLAAEDRTSPISLSPRLVLIFACLPLAIVISSDSEVERPARVDREQKRKLDVPATREGLSKRGESPNATRTTPILSTSSSTHHTDGLDEQACCCNAGG